MTKGDDDLPDNMLDAAALTYVKRQGLALSEARDLVILRCLEAGDADAFAYWVLSGHQPGPLVLRTLAYMAHADVPPQIAERVPFRLIPKSRTPGKAGKRPDPLVALRDELIALNVMAEMTEPGQYDSAISAVHDRVEKALSPKTIRNAYDHHTKAGKETLQLVSLPFQ